MFSVEKVSFCNIIPSRQHIRAILLPETENCCVANWLEVIKYYQVSIADACVNERWVLADSCDRRCPASTFFDDRANGCEVLANTGNLLRREEDGLDRFEEPAGVILKSWQLSQLLSYTLCNWVGWSLRSFGMLRHPNIYLVQFGCIMAMLSTFRRTAPVQSKQGLVYWLDFPWMASVGGFEHKSQTYNLIMGLGVIYLRADVGIGK